MLKIQSGSRPTSPPAANAASRRTRGAARGGVEPEHDGGDRKGKIGGDGKAGRRAGGGDAEQAPVTLEEQRKGEERERSCRDVREEQRRERQHEGRQAENRSDGEAETRLEAVDGPPHQQEQPERGEHDGPEPDLPDGAERHARHRIGVAKVRVRVLRHGMCRAEDEIERRRPDVERRRLRRVVVPVAPHEVARLVCVAIDERMAFGDRPGRRIVRALRAADRRHRHRVRQRDRRERDDAEQGGAAHQRKTKAGRPAHLGGNA